MACQRLQLLPSSRFPCSVNCRLYPLPVPTSVYRPSAQVSAARHRSHNCRRGSEYTRHAPGPLKFLRLPTLAQSNPDTLKVRGDQSVQGRELTVHYLRTDNDLQGWKLQTWGEVEQPTTEFQHLNPDKCTDEEATFTFKLIPEHQKNGYSHWIGLQLFKDGVPDAGGEIVEISTDTEEVWLMQGSKEVFMEQINISSMLKGDLTRSYAHWIDHKTVLWRVDKATLGHDNPVFKLNCSQQGRLQLTDEGLQAADESCQLTLESGPYQSDKFPHLAGCKVLTLSDLPLHQVTSMLQGQLAVTAQDPDGKLLAGTGVQTAGVLDDLFMYEGPLGVNMGPNGDITISLWAPTAQQVELLVFDNARMEQTVHRQPMQLEKGVWSQQGPSSWKGKYYQYLVTVFCPDSQKVESLVTSDPYSISLSADGKCTQIVAMNDSSSMPEGWDEHTPPAASPWTDISIYELHIRDFSISDETVPSELRGKYGAFASPHSAGVKHLRSLQAAGLSHIHLLPCYDIGSIPERAEDQAVLQEDLSQYTIDGEQQQAAVLAIADDDGFNWGYDPVHYMAPEGSYASDPDGLARVVEFRQMVQALHGLGLKVVLDVVYNHTFAAGQHTGQSVLDKVVPGCYHRRMENGDICMSACCNNTASEHGMCERLVIDDIVHWARDYKVDGFRFDIMGHLMLSTMKKIQAALGELTLEQHGVDGKSLYIYGEAWDFGEVSSNQRGCNASQLNIGGMGLGSFNDRFRDAVVGGSPFASPLFQGWVNGLSTASNQYMQSEMSAEAQKELLMQYSDQLRLSMAGNLVDYELEDYKGERRTGQQVMCGAQQAGYAKEPWETVNYADCHDGQTLFDQVIMKAREGTSIEDRCRMNVLALAAVTLSQGVAFFHAGSDILRSKSLDRDSYNSGDWFNRLDWSYSSNNFGVGLPPSSKNKAAWPLHKPRLVPDLQPSSSLIHYCREQFTLLLQLRYSSPLFRLPSAKAIKSQLTFWNTGPHQVPGLIVMQLVSHAQDGEVGGVSDLDYSQIWVLLNAQPDTVVFQFPKGTEALELHPLQASQEHYKACSSTLSEAISVCVAAHTAAVYVQRNQ